MQAYDTTLNGERHDAILGLLDQRARLLDPTSGRFTWRDGFVPPAGSFHDAHLYAYVAGNAVNAVDPTGMFTGLPAVSVSSVISASLRGIKGFAVAQARKSALDAVQRVATGITLRTLAAQAGLGIAV
jgi:RHS repeat-associated protein